MAFTQPVLASAGPDQPAVGTADAQVSTVNRRLAALVTAPNARAAQPRPGMPAIAVQPPGQASRLIAPALLEAAARFTKAERLLHIQSHGLDANFWGAFTGGRGMRVRYIIKF
jgi:hypothetical protein